MSQSVSLHQAARLLLDAQDILILTHKAPDGDTLGSGFALMHALHQLGKRAAVLGSEAVPARFGYLQGSLSPQTFRPKTVITVDVADIKLLGDNQLCYADSVDLAIDHHGSNTCFAKYLLLRADAAANCELVLDLIEEMGVELNPQIADCLYTGLVTDTGCFRHNSTTADSHRAAEKLLTAGADLRLIHQRLFESESRGKIALTVAALQSLRYELDGRCATMVLMRDCINQNGVTDDELEGISALPRQIEGVQVGVTLRQYKSYRGYKISVRTDGSVDASAICRRLGGGGHRGAAGCTFEITDFDAVYRQVLDSVRQELESKGV